MWLLWPDPHRLQHGFSQEQPTELQGCSQDETGGDWGQAGPLIPSHGATLLLWASSGTEQEMLLKVKSDLWFSLPCHRGWRRLFTC